MNLLSKRDFLKLLILPFSQALISCVYNKGESPAPPPNVLLEHTAFLNDFKGATVVGEDEIVITWTDNDVFPLNLVFSSDNGVTEQTLATLTSNTPYVWTVPQLHTTQAFLKLVTTQGETKTVLFNVITSLVFFLNNYPGLEIAGNYKVITTVPYRDIVLRNTGNGFSALSLICTHNGCVAQPDSTQIYCSCHGSLFTTEGNVVNGPATAPLRIFRTKEVPSQKKILLYE